MSLLQAVLWVATVGAVFLPLYIPKRDSANFELNRPSAKALLETAYTHRAATPSTGPSPRETIAAATGGIAKQLNINHVTLHDMRSELCRSSADARSMSPLHLLRVHAVSSAQLEFVVPTERIIAHLSEERAAVGRVGGGAESHSRPPSTAELFDAYFSEADMLLAELLRSRAEASPPWGVPAAHDVSTLLSPDGAKLRFFALAGDLVTPASPASAPTAPVFRAHCLQTYEAPVGFLTHAVRRDKSVLSHPNSAASFLSILAIPAMSISSADRVKWDGDPSSSST